MDPSAEILDGNRMVGTLRLAMDGRKLCRMEISDTKQGWITLILGIEPAGTSPHLLIDKVNGLEEALSESETKEILFEFMETDGVPCQFQTRVVKFHRSGCWMELPKWILRVQKRRFYRVKARLGTEIIFRVDREGQEKATVRDYSMGGVAFFLDRDRMLNIETQVTDVQLRIPQGDGWIEFYNALAVVRRVERHTTGKDICVLEFLGMSEGTKERLWKHIFEEQRMALKKTKHV